APGTPPLALALEAPASIPVGVAQALRLDIHRPAGSPPLPERLRLAYEADDGGRVEGPAEILLAPLDRCEGRAETPCARATLTYAPASAGARTLRVRAEGLVSSRDAAFPLAVARDPLRLDGVGVGPPPEGSPGGSRAVHWRAATTFLSEAPANLTLRASWSAPGFPPVAWEEAAGDLRATRAGVDVVLPFAPRWAAGNYTLTLVARGPDAEGASPPLVFEHAPAPAPARAAAPVEAEVEDRPGTIALTSDSVNADGKLKAPGEAVVTRATVSDPNGLADLVAVVVRVDRLGGGRTTIHEDRIPLDPARTKASVEHRFALAPLREGTYALNLSAERGRASTAERTFVITNAKPTLAASALDPPRAFPAAAVPLAGNLTLADRNFGSGPLDPEPASAFRLLSVKLYRASTLVTDPAWQLSLGDAPAHAGRAVLDLANATRAGPWPASEADGAGRLTVPFSLVVPANAAAGDHHLSVYHASTPTETPALLGTVGFVVEPLPAVKTLVVEPSTFLPGASVRVAGTVEAGARLDGVRLVWTGPEGDLVPPRVISVEGGAFAADLEAPSPLRAGLATTLRAEPLPGGAARATSVKVANAPPTLALAARADGVAWGEGPVRVLPGVARVIEVALAARDPNEAEARVAFTATLLDWNGAAVAGAARLEGASNATAFARVALAGDLAAGRYVLRATARDALGATGSADVAIEVGAWVSAGFPTGRVALAPAPGGLEGRAPLALAGNVRVGAVHVLLAPLASEDRVLAPGGVVATLRGADGRALASATVAANATSVRLAGLDLAPGDVATLGLAWPLPEGTPAGRYDGYVALAVEARS
ncbi:MAG TPA: hypothetical protein VM889_07865, partial [Candidatus Thermoplasmatota archaeon]|nr:hypothetical protein [Candidatus Thermoplasmatota archaeon]